MPPVEVVVPPLYIATGFRTTGFGSATTSVFGFGLTTGLMGSVFVSLGLFIGFLTSGKVTFGASLSLSLVSF